MSNTASALTLPRLVLHSTKSVLGSSTEMLAKYYKLNIAEFIKKRPSFVKKGPFFAVKIAANGLSYSRFGVVVGKKVDKRATERNKIKRMFYEAIRVRNLQSIAGNDVLIIVYPEINQFAREEVIKLVKEYEFVK